MGESAGVEAGTGLERLSAFGFRLTAPGWEGVTSVKTGTFSVRLGDKAHRVTIGADGTARVDDGATLLVSIEGEDLVAVRSGERTQRLVVHASGERRQVFVDGEVYDVAVGAEAAARRRGAARAGSDHLEAPMPAKVTAVLVEAGQPVRKGDVLIKLEAMKMEMAVRAPREGTVKSVACRVGELVQPGVGLLELA
jgi:3-methylcrotonyl-CoA carboxylase alpha subunit